MSTAAKTILDVFKAQEMRRPEAVHPLIKDLELRNLVVAWSMASVSLGVPKGEIPEDDAAKWAWLWTGSKYDRDGLANAMGIPVPRNVGKIVDRARSFRLIYPDGTANEIALQFIRSQIQKELKGKDKKKKGGDADAADDPAAEPASAT